MTASPFDMPGSARPEPPPAPHLAAAPPAAPPCEDIPALIFEVNPVTDAYDRRPSSALKVFATEPGHGFARLGVRYGDRRAEIHLRPHRLRALAADLLARADLIDGITPERADG